VGEEGVAMEYAVVYYVLTVFFWAAQAIIVVALLAIIGAVVFRRQSVRRSVGSPRLALLENGL
jgi:hypothetical protein